MKKLLSVLNRIVKGMTATVERSAYLKAIHELERMGMREQADHLKKEYQSRFDA